jgi:CHRD domain
MRSSNSMTRLSGSALLTLSIAACFPTLVAFAAEPVSPEPKMQTDLPIATAAGLTGAQEVPPVDTTASAVSHITVGGNLAVSGTVDTNGIKGTAAHIHEAAVGANGPPIITLVKSSETQWSVPAGATLTPAQYKTYKAGGLYVNVHSAAHPSGEIRMQLKP